MFDLINFICRGPHTLRHHPVLYYQENDATKCGLSTTKT